MKFELALLLSTVLQTGIAHAASDLTGPLTRAELEKPGYAWMKEGEAKGAAEYAKKPDAVKSVAKGLAATEIEIYLGTWCGDSHDQVPPFLALLDAAKKSAKAEPKSLKLFAVSTKRTYEGYTNPRTVERYPTFIFLRDGKEIGRIVETPTKSLIDDTLAIVSKK